MSGTDERMQQKINGSVCAVISGPAGDHVELGTGAEVIYSASPSR